MEKIGIVICTIYRKKKQELKEYHKRRYRETKESKNNYLNIACA